MKKEKKAKEIAASKAGQKKGDEDQPEFTKIDIRVGQITKVCLCILLNLLLDFFSSI